MIHSAASLVKVHSYSLRWIGAIFLQTSVVVGKSFLGQFKPTLITPPGWVPAAGKLADPPVGSDIGAAAMLWRGHAGQATASGLGIGYKASPKPNIETQECWALLCKGKRRVSSACQGRSLFIWVLATVRIFTSSDGLHPGVTPVQDPCLGPCLPPSEWCSSACKKSAQYQFHCLNDSSSIFLHIQLLLCSIFH